MPLLLDYTIEKETRIGLWQIDESNDWFIEQLKLTSYEKDNLISMKEHRQKEWLSSRWLCHILSDKEERIKLRKDACGKPHFENFQKHLSLSHSKDKVAAIISNTKVGIDIEKIDQKIFRIEGKFISPTESLAIDQNKNLEACHIFWGSKEAMYKAYGKRELDFKKDMHLFPFRIFQNNIELKGTVRKKDVFQEYHIYAQKINEFYLIYSILDHEVNLSIDSNNSQ